jgi:Na+-transporting methylmalonyl-CoA/oxaloacetate decarboxylase gamma subunit
MNTGMLVVIYFLLLLVMAVATAVMSKMKTRTEEQRDEAQQRLDNLRRLNETLKLQIADMEKNGTVAASNEATRTETYQSYLAMQARERELYLVLTEHFPAYIQRAQHANQHLIALACELLISYAISQREKFGSVAIVGTTAAAAITGKKEN